MKVFCLVIIFIFASNLGFCQSAKPNLEDSENIVIAVKENKKHNLTATFYGVIHKPDDTGEQKYKIIKKVVFVDNKTKRETKYVPSGTVPAGNFYFTEIWSPNEDYLVLPIGTTEGFVIFEAQSALKDIEENQILDTIKVKSENSGWFWHEFEKWEDSSSFSFKAGLSGDMWTFKYDFSKKELNCFTAKCEEIYLGTNNKGKVKPLKKGDIEPSKMY